MASLPVVLTRGVGAAAVAARLRLTARTTARPGARLRCSVIPVSFAAGGGDAGDGILNGVAGDELAGAQVVFGEFEDEASGTEPFSLANIYSNNVLEIEGVSDGAGGVIATHVKRTQTYTPTPFTAEVTAPLQSLSNTSYTLTVLGVTYYTNPTNTTFADTNGTVSQSQFFSIVTPGTLIHIVDTRNDGLAEKVEVDN